MEQRKKDIVGGLVVLLIAAGLYFYNWYLIFNKNIYYPKAFIFSGAGMFIGLGLIVFGGYRTERINKGEDISNLSGLKLLTPRWWALLIIGLIFGIASWLYIEWVYGLN